VRIKKHKIALASLPIARASLGGGNIAALFISKGRTKKVWPFFVAKFFLSEIKLRVFF